ncbi:MAG TPA: hypothetical protein VI488_01670 [Candidatus Angelobacter sp.]
MSTMGLGLGGAPTSPDPQAAYRAQLELAKAGIKRGASWFDWIAAFSVINSVISLFNGGIRFVLGLGVTEVVNYEAQRTGGSSGQMIGFAVTVVVAAFFWLMGRFAKQGQRWALILGMFLYLLDAGLLLMMQLWLSVAFHAYALFMPTKTFAAIKQFEAAKQDAEAHGVFLGAATS